MLGNRAIYHDGWKAVTYYGTEGMIYDGVTDPSKPFDDDRWELYHVAEDFSEAHDLAGEYPENCASCRRSGGPKPGATRYCRWTLAAR